MNPRTAKHKLLITLQERLPKGLTEYQLKYAKKHVFDKAATESRNTMMCTECGGTWHVKNGKDITEVVCPHCGKKLNYVKHNSLRYKEIEYFCNSLAIQGFQVVRYWQFRKFVKPGDVKIEFEEIGALWFDDKGHYESFCLPRSFMPRYVDSWNFYADIKLRRVDHLHECPVTAMLTTSKIPILKQRGWNGKPVGYKPVNVISGLIKYPMYETCYKTGHYGVCAAMDGGYAWKNPDRDEKLARIFKICNRHHIIFKTYQDWSDMIDYVSDLEYFKMDIYNAQYLTRNDWKEEHLRLSARRHEIEETLHEQREREWAEQRALDAENKRKWALEYAPRFMDMMLQKGSIAIKPLILWDDFCAEHEAHGHCIKTYFGKADTLLISILKDGVRTETAEINLDKNELIQCRGKNNKSSKWHNEIVKFIQESMDIFQKRYKKKMVFNTLPAIIQKPIFKVA